MWKLGCVQPRQNVAKRFYNGNGGVLNTLFWWRKSCNYAAEKAILCVVFEELSEPDEIGINMFLILQLIHSMLQSLPLTSRIKENIPIEWRDLWKLWFLIIVTQHLLHISGWKDKHFRWRIIHFFPPRLCYNLYDLIIFIESIRLIIIADHCCCAMIL